MQRRSCVVAIVIVTLFAGEARAEWRQLGVQVGGSGFLQGVARYGVVQGLSVEGGAMAITHGMNLSLGVEVEAYRRGRVALYASGGGALAGAFGPVLVEPDCTGDDCAVRPAGTVLGFGYLRAGVRLRLRDGSTAVAVDAGGWLGRWSDDSGVRPAAGWFAAPVVGVSYLLMLDG